MQVIADERYERNQYLEWKRQHNAQIRAQINELKKLKAEYQAFLGAINNLSGDLESCHSLVSTTYSKIKQGVKCKDIDLSVEEINNYATEVNGLSQKIESILSDIKNEIENIDDKIQALRSRLIP